MSFPDSNLVDDPPKSWRLILGLGLGLLLAGLAIFSFQVYQDRQTEERESAARLARGAAKTPAELQAVASRFPGTAQSALALEEAGARALEAHDAAGAAAAFQALLKMPKLDPELRDAAQVGLASAQEAQGKPDEAAATYLVVARRGKGSPFAAYAYQSAAGIYERRDDKVNRRKILSEMQTLGPGSPFVQQAARQLAELNAEAAAQPAPAPAAKGAVVAP